MHLNVKIASQQPDIFLMALKGLNVEAKNCIGIEDAYSGIEAINTSGMHSVGVGSKGILKKCKFSSRKYNIFGI